MIRKKILKLAKRLNNFTLDDLAITLELNEEDEVNVRKYLSTLVKKEIVQKISDEKYKYIDDKVENSAKKIKQAFKQAERAPKVKIEPKVTKIIKYDNYQLYLNSSVAVKKRVDKYLAVIHASENLKGSHLKSFLEQWNKQFPEMKTSKSSLMKAKKLLLSKGLAALILTNKNPETNAKRKIYDSIYNYFKSYYLKGRGSTVVRARELAIENFRRLNPSINPFKPPSDSYFRKRLAAEFTKEEIKQFRTAKTKGEAN